MASKISRAVALALSCASLNVPPLSALAGDAPAQPPRKWDPWAEIGGYASNRSYADRGEAALWVPLLQDGRSIFFTDIRGKLFDDDQHEGNVAIGYRFMGANGWNPGIWAGLDRRYTLFGNDFDQFSFGAELLSRDWDFRLNGYVPIDDAKAISGAAGASVVVTGGSIFLGSGGLEEVALWGVDYEVGYRIPLEVYGLDGRAPDPQGGPMPGGRHNDLRVFLGGFYFDADAFQDEVVGPRIRAEWRIENILDDWEGSRLTFEASAQYDDVRETQVEAGVRLRIPLGGVTDTARFQLSAQEKRMTEGVKRDTDVVTVQQSSGPATLEPVEDAETGMDFDSLTIVANGGDLQAAMTGAGNEALIVAQGGAADFGAVSILTAQTLLGGGGTIQLRGLNTGRLAEYTAPGTRPTIATNTTGIVAQNAFRVSNVTFDGQGGGFAAIHLHGATTITDVSMTDFSIGLLLDRPVTYTIRDSTLSGSTAAISVSQGANVLLDDSTVQNSGTGIQMDGLFGANTIAVNNTAFTGNFTGYLFDFESAAHNVAASAGNTDTSVSSGVCVLGGGGSFAGAIGIGGASVVSADCD